MCGCFFMLRWEETTNSRRKRREKEDEKGKGKEEGKKLTLGTVCMVVPQASTCDS